MQIDFENPSQDIDLPDRRDAGPKAKSKVVRIAGATSVVLALAMATGGIAGAATTNSAGSPAGALKPRHGVGLGGTRPAAVGTVKSIGANTFTLTTRSGTVMTVNVATATTTYQDRGVTAPTFANVTVGSHVAVMGTDSANTVAATKVLIGGLGGHRFGSGIRPAAVGTVKSVGAGTFTLTTRSGTVMTVNVATATTSYQERGVTAPTFANVTVGSRVAVVGTHTANTVAATRVLIGGLGGHRFGNGSGTRPAA